MLVYVSRAVIIDFYSVSLWCLCLLVSVLLWCLSNMVLVNKSTKTFFPRLLLISLALALGLVLHVLLSRRRFVSSYAIGWDMALHIPFLPWGFNCLTFSPTQRPIYSKAHFIRNPSFNTFKCSPFTRWNIVCYTMVPICLYFGLENHL